MGAGILRSNSIQEMFIFYWYDLEEEWQMKSNCLIKNIIPIANINHLILKEILQQKQSFPIFCNEIIS